MMQPTSRRMDSKGKRCSRAAGRRRAVVHVASQQRASSGEMGPAGGATELVGDVLQAAAVVGVEQAVGHGQRGAGDAWSDEGISITVAADPGTEGDEAGQIGEVGLDAILGLQCGGHLGVEHGEGGEDGGLVVVEGHADSSRTAGRAMRTSSVCHRAVISAMTSCSGPRVRPRARGCGQAAPAGWRCGGAWTSRSGARPRWGVR